MKMSTTISKQDFRDAMSRIATAVHIVATEGEAGKTGLTISAMSSVSDTPPLLLFCIKKDGQSNDILIKNKKFSLNTLTKSHQQLSNIFAGQAEIYGIDRFQTGTWIKGANNTPILEDALVTFECDIEHVTQAGSHNVIIGKITRILSPSNNKALLYHQRDYKTL